MKAVGVFTATRWEAGAVARALTVEKEQRLPGGRCVVGRRGNCSVRLYQAGIGETSWRGVCQDALSAHAFDVVVSSGFACALAPAQIGDLLIGTEVVRHDDLNASGTPADRIACTEPWKQQLIESARRVGLTALAGRFVTVSDVVCLAREKRVIAAATGGVGLDMESAALGLVARDRRVPFALVRAASDLLDEDLPLDFNVFRARGGWLRGLAQGLMHPSCVTGLWRLRRQSAEASRRMTRFFESFLDS